MLSPPLYKTYAVVLLNLAYLGSAMAQPMHTVGSGDNRDGYEQIEYKSASEQIERRAGGAQSVGGEIPLGLPRLNVPIDRDRVALGRRLFFDRRLSVNATLSCAMCHIPEQGFTQNEIATPVGLQGRSVRRNAPSLYNVAYQRSLFHDGRGVSLETQIWEPLLAHNEMGNDSRQTVIKNLKAIEAYAVSFAKVFPDGVTAANLGLALAAYQRSLLSANSLFDRWFFGGDQTALSPLAKKGFEIFKEVDCHTCHVLDDPSEGSGTLFTNHGFFNTGVGYRAAHADPPSKVQLAPGVFVDLAIEIDLKTPFDNGRQEVSGLQGQRWHYRVPTLRNVALTAPYMHDGSLPTLESVIEYYDQGGDRRDPGLDPRLRPLGLSQLNKRRLLSFLQAITGSNVDALAADGRSVEIGDRQ